MIFFGSNSYSTSSSFCLLASAALWYLLAVHEDGFIEFITGRGAVIPPWSIWVGVNISLNTFYSGQLYFNKSDKYSLPLLASCLWRAVNLVSLVGFDDVFLLDQAASASLNHVWTYCQISVQPQQPPTHVERGGHVEGEAETVGVRRGGWEVEGVEAGRETLGLHEGAGVGKRTGASGSAVLLPALTVRWDRGEDVTPWGSASAHLAHGRTDSRALRLCRGSRSNRNNVVA